MEAEALKQLRRRFWVERAIYLSLIAVLVLGYLVGPEETERRKPSARPSSAAVRDAYAIVVNGKPLTALASQREVEDALNAVKARYSADIPNLLEEPSFKEPVVVKRQAVPARLIAPDANTAAEVLCGGSGAVGVHRVAAGENAWLIAKRLGMTQEELAKLNPGRDLEHLNVGDLLRTRPDAVILTVVTKEVRTRRVYIPPEERRIASPRMYRGKQILVQPGRWGLKEIKYVRVCENGVPVSKVEQAVRIVRRPSARVVIVGTKPRPSGV